MYFLVTNLYLNIHLGPIAFEIQRSLGHKGCPYDNAVAEATFKIIRLEVAISPLLLK